MNPFLTIIVPTYNRSLELARCLSSIDIKDNLEIIVSDNHSSYDPNEYIPIGLKSVCKIFIQDENIGPRENIYQAGYLGSGKYTLFITDDDYFLPGKLYLLIAALRDKSPLIAYASCIINFEVQKKNKFYGTSPKLLFRPGAIQRGHVLSGLVVETRELKKALTEHADILRNTWYFSMGILCAIQVKPYLYSDPLLIHTWENETFWGIEPTESKILEKDKLNLATQMAKYGKLSYLELFLLRVIFNKKSVIPLRIFYYIKNFYFNIKRVAFMKKVI